MDGMDPLREREFCLLQLWALWHAQVPEITKMSITHIHRVGWVPTTQLSCAREMRQEMDKLWCHRRKGMHTRAEIVYVMFLMCLRVRVMAQGTYKLGTCLNMFEHVWTCLNMFEHVWTCLNMFEHVWTCLTAAGQIYIPATLPPALCVENSNLKIQIWKFKYGPADSADRGEAISCDIMRYHLRAQTLVWQAFCDTSSTGGMLRDWPSLC